MSARGLGEELAELERTDPKVRAAAMSFERMKQTILEGRQHPIPCVDETCSWHHNNSAEELASKTGRTVREWQEALNALGARKYLLPAIEDLVAWGHLPLTAANLIMMSDAEQFAISKVIYRIDPERAPEWSFRRAQPRPFIYDPANQTVRSPINPGVWDRFPIHDPVWRMT